jgi:hypothetical protein
LGGVVVGGVVELQSLWGLALCCRITALLLRYSCYITTEAFLLQHYCCRIAALLLRQW